MKQPHKTLEGVMIELEQDKPKVMVIDDVAETRALIGDMLREMGFDSVMEAGDGAEALKKLKQERAHLILCDYRMVGMSGLDLLSQLRNHPYLVDKPFIVVRAVSEPPVIETALGLGADEYIVKPIGFCKLRDTVVDVIRRRCT